MAVLVIALILSSGYFWLAIVGLQPPTQEDGNSMPTSVQGMPVISVEAALRMIAAGALDGREVAVAGYYSQASVAISCPFVMRGVSALESFCDESAFADVPRGICTATPNSSTCGDQGFAFIRPVFMAESGEIAATLGGAPGTRLIEAIVVGHSGDPRADQCPVELQTKCTHAFVVDRVAWLAGQSRNLAITALGDINPQLALDELMQAASVNADERFLNIVALPATEIADIEPRLRHPGHETVWLVRLIDPNSGLSDADPSRSVTTSLIDDRTATVLGAVSLNVTGWQPARLSIIATVAGDANDRSQINFALESDGTVLQAGELRSLMSAGTTAEFGRMALPQLLDAGSYRLTISRLPTGGGSPESCSILLDLGPDQDETANAVFEQAGAPCTWPDLSVHGATDFE